jgi:hypothetical protein
MLIAESVAAWPRLAWIARVEPGSPVIVRHGAAVERGDGWCAEAVWPGPFDEGDFDRTDLVIGTGLRVRGDEVVFVVSSDTLNRLYTFRDEAALLVSNSLPCLLAEADADLIEGFDYGRALGSIVHGPRLADKTMPTTPVGIAYYDNLHTAGDALTVVPKPRLAPAFADFSTYRDYLMASARRLGSNLRACGRRHTVTPVASISSGYDSPAAAVVAREAGTAHAVTLRHGQRTLGNPIDTDDSGAAVAARLGLTCRVYERTHIHADIEDSYWAALGTPGDLNLSAFDYPAPVCLLFSGCMGDILWDRHRVQPSFLSRKDTSGSRFSEARLEHGVLLCSPVFWGCHQEDQILALGRRPEMAPWTLGTSYDRPVPRRIVEEAGVPRGSFARAKRASSFSRRLGRPRSKTLQADFERFMASRGRRAGTRESEALGYVLNGIDYYVLNRLPAPLRFACSAWAPLPSPTDFFLWANARLVERYRR